LRRSDELGAMAGALAIFKANMIDAARLRGEKSEVEQRQALHRKAEMQKLADDLEGAVGKIVGAVSSASNV
jgi:hypothetical protein